MADYGFPSPTIPTGCFEPDIKLEIFSELAFLEADIELLYYYSCLANPLDQLALPSNVTVHAKFWPKNVDTCVFLESGSGFHEWRMIRELKRQGIQFSNVLFLDETYSHRINPEWSRAWKNLETKHGVRLTTLSHYHDLYPVAGGLGACLLFCVNPSMGGRPSSPPAFYWPLMIQRVNDRVCFAKANARYLNKERVGEKERGLLSGTPEFKIDLYVSELLFRRDWHNILVCIRTGCRSALLCPALAEAGRLDLLQEAHEAGCAMDEDCCTLAAKGGHLACLEYAHNHGCRLSSAVVYAANRAGNLPCLIYVFEHSPQNYRHEILHAGGAAEGGHLACLKYGHERGAELSSYYTSDAAENGHLTCLQYLRKHGCEWGYDVLAGAAKNGHLSCLQFAVRNGCHSYYRHAKSNAAENGHLTCLQFLHRQCPDWDEHTRAARSGHLACLEFAHRNGCPWVDTMGSAVAFNHLACVQYAYENGCDWANTTCQLAARWGQLDCLRFAYSSGCPWSAATCREAARGGHLHILRFAKEKGCPWDETTCWAAARSSNLECLMYAHEAGCPWDKSTCKVAAAAGSLPCLTYAHENGCPWDEDTCCAAANDGNLDCLSYAHENGCPWDEQTTLRAAVSSHIECLLYAFTNGCGMSGNVTKKKCKKCYDHLVKSVS